MQARQSVRGNAFDEIQLEKLERLQLEAFRQVSPARATDLEHFSNLSMPVKQVAEHPIRAKEAGVPGDHAAQGRFGLDVAVELHQRRAVVVERVGPVRPFPEHRLQLRCRSGQIALRFEYVEQCRACVYIARALAQRASELRYRGFRLALRLQHICVHYACVRKIRPAAQRLLQQPLGLRQLTGRREKLAQFVIRSGVGRVASKGLRGRADRAGHTPPGLEPDAKIDMRPRQSLSEGAYQSW